MDLLLGRNLATATEPSLKPLYQLLVGYPDWCVRHDRIKRLLCNAVKHDSVTATNYLVWRVAMGDTNEEIQSEKQVPEQQSAQDTTPWEDKPVYTPDGSRNIRTLSEEE